MTTHALFERYGAIVGEDVQVLESCLLALMHPSMPVPPGEWMTRTLRVLEIGMHDGGTARGIERFVHENGCALRYFGIDPDDGTTRPRHRPDRGTEIIGDSAHVFDQVPGGLDLVWVDGCHCVNHVVLDTVHYAPKVRPGGFMLFHDANPIGQGIHHQPCGGPDTPAFGLAIARGHALIRWPFPGWSKFAEKFPDDRSDCGTVAYRKDS